MTSTEHDDSLWQQKGATLSDTTARKEFGLTQAEIIAAIRAGRLRYRQAWMHGNPWLRLLRHEVEALVRELHGDEGLARRKVAAELEKIRKELARLRSAIAVLEKRRRELTGESAG